jgi:hypothetical protein
MTLTYSRCARAASSPRSSVVIAFLLATATFSFGQELKAASTLGFSVRVLGASSAEFLTLRVTALVADGSSSSVTIPLSNQSMKVAGQSATQVIARFRGDTANTRALTARIDGGDMQKFRPETATSAVLIIPKEHLADGTSFRNRILKLNWKTAPTEDTSNVLEIEMRQY